MENSTPCKSKTVKDIQKPWVRVKVSVKAATHEPTLTADIDGRQ